MAKCLTVNLGLIGYAEAYALQKRIVAGKTSRGVTLTHEGMAIANGRIYFVPEDGPSRVLQARCRELLERPPPPQWNGVHVALAK